MRWVGYVGNVVGNELVHLRLSAGLNERKFELRIFIDFLDTIKNCKNNPN